MPTTSVTADDFTHIYKQATNWTDAVSDDTGTALGNPVSVGVYFLYTPATIYINYRTFGAFDLSGLSGTVTSLQLELTKHGNSNNTGLSYFVVRGSDNKSAGSGNAAGIPFTTDHYLSGVAGFDGDDYPYEASGFSDGAGDGSFAIWSAEQSQPTSVADDAQFTIDLNSTAVAYANTIIGTSTKFFVAIINEHDIDNTYGSATLSSGLGTQGTFVYPEDDSTAANRPKLKVTTSAAAAPSPPKMFTKVDGGSLKVDGGKVKIGE